MTKYATNNYESHFSLLCTCTIASIAAFLFTFQCFDQEVQRYNDRVSGMFILAVMLILIASLCSINVTGSCKLPMLILSDIETKD